MRFGRACWITLLALGGCDEPQAMWGTAGESAAVTAHDSSRHGTSSGPTDSAAPPDAGLAAVEPDAGPVAEADAGAPDAGAVSPAIAPDAGPECLAAQTLCGDACTSLASDPSNCGACGALCAAGQSCVAGACALVCAGGRTACAGSCLDLQSDPDDCGACGEACADGQACVEGACVPAGCGRFSGETGSSWTLLAPSTLGTPGFSDASPPGQTGIFGLQNETLVGYSPDTGAWSSLTAPPVFTGSWPGPAWVGSGLFVVAGGQVLRYDIGGGAWSSLLSGVPDTGDNANTHDDQQNVYTVDLAGHVLRYGVAAGALTDLSPSTPLGAVAQPRLAYDSCSGLLYVAPSAGAPSLFSIDPASGATVPLAPIPDTQVSQIFCGDRSGHLYAGGNLSGAWFWQYTIATNSWARIPSPPASGDDLGACTVSGDNNLYFAAGSGGTFARLALK
ncbi:MAG TPA: hypothetical protein VMB50_04000 [Myxococcales bacterium]|nr:hypothetical protein [Myxococcales bacterium]